MSQIQMQARSSANGNLYTWIVGAPDFAGAAYPGPGSPQDVAIASAPSPEQTDVAAGADIPDANDTYTWSNAQQIRRVQPGVLTANRSITLGAIGPSLGDRWFFPMFVQTHTLAFNNGGIGAGTLFTAPVGYIGTPIFRFNGTDWEVVGL